MTINPLVLIPLARADELEAAASATALEARARHLAGYDWALLVPFELERTTLITGPRIIGTPDRYWNRGPDGRRGYSPLMCSPGLYRELADRGYTHTLIYQLDAIVFRDELEQWCAEPIDYIGAPHDEPYPARGGNGGFSLRRLEAFVKALEGLADWVDVDRYWQAFGVSEDLVWSGGGVARAGFRPANQLESARFAWETRPALWHGWVGNQLRDQIPFGAHGYQRHSPWWWELRGGVRALAGLVGGEIDGTQDQLRLDPAPVPPAADKIEHDAG